MRLTLAVGVTLAGLSASCCVARGSRIRVRRGTKPVESLKLGDEVLCVNPETGERVVARLSGIRVSRRECFEFGIGDATLRCTADHPLYDPDAKVWADAGDWVLGRRSSLLRVPDDDEAPVEHVQPITSAVAGLDEVFDLTVDHPLHNFVADGVLVHNKRPPSPCNAQTVIPASSCEELQACAPNETAVQGGCRMPGGIFCGCAQPDGGFVTRSPGDNPVPQPTLPDFHAAGDGGQDSGVTDAGSRDGG
jgi:hypothetical protein